MGVSSEAMGVREVSAEYGLQAAKPGVPVGYKQSEVGVIPEDWNTVTLGSVTVLMTNGFVGTATKHYVPDESGVLYIQGYNVEENSFNFHGIKYVSEDFHKSHLKSCLRGGDLLTVQTGDVGLTTTVPESLSGSNCHALIISRFDQKRVCSAFVSYYLNSKPGRSRLRLIETGTTMKHLNVGDMLQFLVPLPSTREEQLAIANALSDMDALLDGLDRLIAKKRDLKQATMQQLLTGQTRLPGFEGEWMVKRLGEIAIIKDGTHQTPKYVSAGIPFYSVEHVTSGDFTNTKFISVEEHRFLTRSFKIEKGDILMTRIGSIGDCKLVDWEVDASFYVSLALLKIKSGISAVFVSQYSKSKAFKEEVELHSLPSAVPKKINLGPISDVVINLPPTLNEQTAIATILSDMDAEIEALEQRRRKTRDLKQAMMQELLTGRTRLVVTEVARA